MDILQQQLSIYVARLLSILLPLISETDLQPLVASSVLIRGTRIRAILFP